MEECTACVHNGEPPADTLPFLLTGARALTANYPTEAANWLYQMEAITAIHPESSHYHTPMEVLRQRLDGASPLWHRAV